MILDFKFQDVMRLSNIKRWGIIEMSREQSVAEHSYNVAMIVSAIAEIVGMDDEDRLILVEWALAHDLPELVTGDIPTPFKAAMKDFLPHVEQEEFPKWNRDKEALTLEAELVCKAADLIDAIQFAQRFCIDTRKETIMAEMKSKLKKVLCSLRDDVNVRYAIVIQATSGWFYGWA